MSYYGLVLGYFYFPYLIWIVVFCYSITTKTSRETPPNNTAQTLQKGVTENEQNYPSQIRRAEVPQHQTVIQQRYPTVEYPVESTHCKERDFCALLF